MRHEGSADRARLSLWLGLMLIASLGCILPGPGFPEGGGDFPFDDVSGDDWEEDVEERREERDDPSSVDYRGRFEATLGGERRATLDADALGEATYEYIERDLTGAPPHCQITLADREPDAEGRQGYMIFQYLGPSCAPPAGTYELFGDWEEAAGQEAFVLKTVQLDTETDDLVRYERFLGARGVLEITSSSFGRVEGVFDLMLTRKIIDDGEELAAEVEARGDFEAVERP